jgi:hypothetical protein
MELPGTHRVKVLLWGFGFMNKLIMRYLLEKDYSIVGVITRSNIGEDPYKIADLEKFKEVNHEIKITSYLNAEETLKEMLDRPQICVLSTKSDLKDIYNELKILAKYKINVVTIAEELFYPYNTSPDLTKEIDSLFKENNVTVIATGVQDYFTGIISTGLINSCHKVEKISIHCRYNADLFGSSDGTFSYGKNKEFFYEKYKDNPNPINSSFTPWLAAMFNWRVVEQSIQYIPVLLKLEEFESNVYGNIKKDHVIGEIYEVTSKCENGVLIVHVLEGLIFHSDNDKEMTSWKIEGEPSFEMICNDPATPEITCASAVNRIMQVIESKEKGYIPTYKLSLHNPTN